MRIVMPAVRYGISLLLTVVGVYLLSTQTDKWGGLGVMLVGSAAIVLLLNTLFRVSIKSNQERSEEERAREYYDRHGRWPDGSS